MYAPSFSDATVCDPNLLAHVVVSQNRAKSIRTRNACARIHAQRTQIVCKVFCIVEALPTSAACPRCFSSTATDIIAAPALHHARARRKHTQASSQERRDAKLAQNILPFRNRGNLLLCTLLFGNVAVNCLLSIIMADLTSVLLLIGVSNRSKAKWAVLIGDDTGP